MLKLTNVNKTHETGARAVVALRDVSLSVSPGEFVAIMGPSGSGKSTLLNLAGLLDRPTSGEVFIDGRETSRLSETERAAIRRRDVGFVFQSYNLIPSLTVLENVALPLSFDGNKSARELASQALVDVGIDNLADTYPGLISGGEAQRVAIARALAGPRRLLLADEPTGALDTATGDQVMELLRSRITGDVAGLLITHEPRFAAWADRTIYLRDGMIHDV
ncbi:MULTISPECIES: ABC transporter ATP-binding protein [Corynebacterium]|uniref:ABC transporter ATP-binding protein n=2 Tax=Corynebacterium glucuronolyticum TaxID=39791 RepID=A0A7T4EG02_9CORY|nr:MULTISPECIES: ABC transporter ATP-binding protein [Corynebacterium]EEI64076.1 ABC transporter, ATP-binding protein [Corynebacterium glucuronolyticum ATCC 51866]OFO48930.1 macrolide ABC transporter ATP-binding protein [Corynebacterium sp. HMSC073D01]QQB46685.1 ABC transporter ATP-binding protein [Corynebacterium glucuronolyticum]QRP70830.1 ABC transporter ATP-binding protein [Corynebacterium glucuronolyticum]WKD62500.1 ABC transporter ATP-binding protein YxdL [Corynebacterium glucuronolyticu